MQYAYLIGMIWKCTFLKNTTERKIKMLYYYQEKEECSRLIMIKHMQSIQCESTFIKELYFIAHPFTFLYPQTTCIVLYFNLTLIYNNPCSHLVFFWPLQIYYPQIL